MTDAPLAGIRVLDLTRLLPGPMCTLYLADLGANVIKIEDTGAGDYARTLATTASTPPRSMSAAGPPQGANYAPSGGSAAAQPQAWGDHARAAGPPQGANYAPSGGSAAAQPQAWGDHARAAGPPQGANYAPSGGSAAAQPQAWGDHARAAGPPQGANYAPSGGSAAPQPRAWGDHASAAGPPQGANYAPSGGSAAAQPQAWGAPASAWYRAINRNKRSLAVDLKTADGHAAFMALARDADVVVEGFRPGAVRALRVDYDAVRAINPRIVYCALSGYGQTGPRALAAGHDINYLGYAGVLNHTGERGGAPALANLQIADLLGGAATAAIGILGALLGAQRSGGGRYVDVAMADAVLAHQIFALGSLEDAGHVAARGEDLLTGGVPCYGVYETRDGGWLAVGALESKFWRALCETLDRTDLVPLQFAVGAEGERVRETLALIFAQQTRQAWSARFANVDCCVTPVLTFAEALADPQFAARAMVVRRPDGSRQYAPPFAFAPAAFSVTRDAPAHGEHTREVLHEAGYTDDAIDRLIDARVIKTAL